MRPARASSETDRQSRPPFSACTVPSRIALSGALLQAQQTTHPPISSRGPLRLASHACSISTCSAPLHALSAMDIAGRITSSQQLPSLSIMAENRRLQGMQSTRAPASTTSPPHTRPGVTAPVPPVLPSGTPARRGCLTNWWKAQSIPPWWRAVMPSSSSPVWCRPSVKQDRPSSP